jgi:hypothetical protein
MTAERRIGTEADFWKSVQERLDRRLDPVDDPGIRDWVSDHPEVLEELAELRWGVGRIEAAARRRGSARRRAGAWVAAAAVLLAAGITFFSWPGRDDPARGGEAPAVSAATGPSSRVLRYRVTETTRTGRSWTRRVTGTDGGRTERSIELEPVRIREGIARVGPTRIRTAVERSGGR